MNESVTLQVIVEPCGTEAVCEVSVPLPDTETFALAVVYDPSSILTELLLKSKQLHQQLIVIQMLHLLVLLEVVVVDHRLQL